MHFRRLLVGLSVAAASVLSGLGPGDTAPDLTGVTYVRGAAPDLSAQPTLIEFWATWCGPCRRSIPHLAELQKTHGTKLAVVGLSDEDEATVRNFVQTQGEAMAYTVGVVPKDVRAAYMAGRDGIPCAFLVTPQKRVAWVGHPAAVDEVLAPVVSGRFDLERAAVIAPLEKALDGAMRSRNAALITEAADAPLAKAPAHASALRIRIALARQAGDVRAARRVYEKVDVAALSDAEAGAMAHALLAEPDLAFRFPDLARRFIERVCALAPGRPAALVLQARYAYVIGRLDEAIALQEKAAAADPQAAAGLEYYRRVRTLRDTP